MSKGKSNQENIKLASEYATCNVRKIRSLMEYFYRETKDSTFKKAVDELDVIKIGFNDVIITKATAPYFIRFEKEIINQDVESLLNFDYTTLINPGTENDTDKTIRSLITLIKHMWVNGSEMQRSNRITRKVCRQL